MLFELGAVDFPSRFSIDFQRNRGIFGVPEFAFVNDIKADRFDPDTVYAALVNHKEGDFKPYLIRSTDRGKTWNAITGDLPDRHLVWRVIQDHKKKDLLFAGTEFGKINGCTQPQRDRH